MEVKEDEPHKSTDHNGTSNGLSKQIVNHVILQENLTSLDLSSKNIKVLNENVKLPPTLLQLDLSQNSLKDVPDAVLNLENLKLLNLSHNEIQYFDGTPNFCHSLEQLDMSDNRLLGPPYWVWAETPKNLTKLKLNNNRNISLSFKDGYFEELLTYPTLIVEAHLENCSLSKYKEFILTFPKAKVLHLGTNSCSSSKNTLLEMPFKGIDQCNDLETLSMCNTDLYTINSSVEMFKNLVEINLAYNDLSGLPKEFCNLENLEICTLSVNKIIYLPEEINNLRKLVRLYLDSNEICMLPDKLHEIQSLKTLDLYDNNLNDVPENFGHLEEIDVAYNCFEEPEDVDYLEKKERLRLAHENRFNGRKEVLERSDDSSSDSATEDDEELYDIIFSGKKIDSPTNPDPPSSPEDWDSDAYWVPCNHYVIRSTQSAWLHYVKRKMKEGNFCPMDAHVISVAEKIKYERLCNPQVVYESEGQFDDYSSDET